MTRHTPFKRADRVGGELLKTLGLLLAEGIIKDPRLMMVSFTGIKLSDDLRHADVYFSQIGDDEEHAHTAKVLKNSAGFLKREVARRIKLRYVPELRFHFDPSLERGARIAEILKQAQPPAPEPAEEEDADD